MIAQEQARSLLRSSEPHSLHPHISDKPVGQNFWRITDAALRKLDLQESSLIDCPWYDGAEHCQRNGDPHCLVHVFRRAELVDYINGGWQALEKQRKAAQAAVEIGG